MSLKTLVVSFVVFAAVGCALALAEDDADDIEIIMSDMPLTKTADAREIEVVCINEQIANTLAAAAAESNESGAQTLLVLMLIGACSIAEPSAIEDGPKAPGITNI